MLAFVPHGSRLPEKFDMKQLSRLMLTCAAVLYFPAALADVKPNIVYILVDNWGWGDLSIQGSTIQTPNIDQFASEGLRLTNFNSPRVHSFP